MRDPLPVIISSENWIMRQTSDTLLFPRYNEMSQEQRLETLLFGNSQCFTLPLMHRYKNMLQWKGEENTLFVRYEDLVGESGEIILSDINEKMLKLGKARSLDKNKLNIKTAVADAEYLPFPDNRFNCITIGFGIRNVTNKIEALKNFYRCLKPGGRLLVLEFSKPEAPLISDLYDFYSFKILPKLGKFFAQDEESYQYLAESIRMHPSQEEFKQMLESVNFKNVSYDIMTAGIVTLHISEK